MDNVYVMAGIPMIMQAMLSSLEGKLRSGLWCEATRFALIPASQIADALSALQDEFSNVDIGSYPFFRDERYGTILVIRGTDTDLLATVAARIMAAVEAIGNTRRHGTDRMKQSIVVVFSLLLGATFGGLTKGYADTHQGTAIFSGDPTQVFRSANQPNRVAASVEAKQQCEQARSKREGYCEIVSIDGAKVGRAVELKPDDKTHPLFLWRYDSNRLLRGTVHVLKRVYPLPRQYEQAFQASEKLVVEAAIDKIEPEQLQQKMLSYALLKQGTLRDVLSPSTYQQLNHYAQTYGLPLEQMQGFNPALISQQLSVFAIMAGLRPNTGHGSAL